jgi:hypothetical protein
MSRQFNKERFETVIKLVDVFLKFSIVAIFVLLGILGIAFITTIVLPTDLYDFDLANLEHTSVQFFGLDYDLSALGLDGIVNVKWIAVTGAFALLINLSFYQYVQVLLKKVMANIRQQHPFNPSNVTYLKYMGIGFLVASLLLPAFNSIFFVQVMNTLELFDVNVNASLDFQLIYMGVIVLILAYIFDYGSYLQEDHDLTV